MNDERNGGTSPEERLARLERDYRAVRRQQRATLFALPVLAGFALFAGANADQAGKFDTVVARELILKDASGATRVRIGDDPGFTAAYSQKFMTQDGKARVRIITTAGHGSFDLVDDRSIERVSLSLAPDGAAQLQMNESLGAARFRSSIKPDDSFISVLWDKNKQNRSTNYMSANNSVGSVISDANGKSRLSDYIDPAGDVFRQMYDTEGKSRIRHVSYANGRVDQIFCDAKGKTRVSLTMKRDGNAGIGLNDADGVERILMGTGPEGQAVQVFRDRNAKSRWSVLSDPTGEIRQTILDDDANPRFILSAGTDTEASIKALDPNKVSRFRIATGLPDGISNLIYNDAKGRTRAAIGSLMDGTTGVRVVDENDNPVR